MKFFEQNGKALTDSAGYAVVACRWGWINNGYDILLVTTDKNRAIEKAEWYADHRGGKYGASVYDSDGKEIYHASSSYGEPTMENNNRIDMFERIGNQISGEIEMGEEVTHEKAYKFYDDAKRICDILSKHNSETGKQP